MKSFTSLSKERYTTKKYIKKKISDDDIQKLKEILRLSPSSIDSQPWKFFFVSDNEIKSKLADASYFNKDRINEASHLVVFKVINDINLFEKQINEHLPEGAIGYYNSFLKKLPENKLKSWLGTSSISFIRFFLKCLCFYGYRFYTYGRIRIRKIRCYFIRKWL